MGECRIKKFWFLFFIFTGFVSVCGCETVNAIRAGDITMQDFIGMVKLKDTDTNKINYDPDADKKETNKADGWVRKNLW